MSEDEKYLSLLKELGELLRQKNDTISYQKYTIESLREQNKKKINCQ